MPAKRILVVEDEEILRLGTTLHLKSFGYEVVGNLRSGEDALEKIMDLKPDVILMDIELAGDLDGIETTRQIKEKWDVPVIYLSVHSDSKTMERAESTNPFRYMRKPFNDEELKFSIEMAVKTHIKEQKLQKKIEGYQKIFSEIPGVLYRINSEYQLVFYNNLIEEISGYSLEEYKNREFCCLFDLIVSEDLENVQKILNEGLDSKKLFKLNYRIKNKDGSIKNIQEIVNPVYKTNGELDYIEGLILDNI